MSKNLEIFVFMGKKVRVVNRDGVVWFVANDVGKVLGLANIRDTIRKVLHESEWTYVEKRYVSDEAMDLSIEKSVTSCCESSVKIPVENFYTSKVRNIKLVAVNESGLYTLIMRSTRPESKAFRHWVTSDVLPSLRKTGRYELLERDNGISRKKPIDFCAYEVDPVPESQRVYIRIGNYMSLCVPMNESGYRLIKSLCDINRHG